MKKTFATKLTPSRSIAAFAIPLAVAGALWLNHFSLTSHARAADNPPVYDYADQVSRLVQSQKIDDLAKLDIPTSDPKLEQLHKWTQSYVAERQKQLKGRAGEYSDAVKKAQDLLTKDRFDDAMIQIVRAYQIADDQNAFLEQQWVKDFTALVAKRAADLEKSGNWIESLQLYSDLNSLYEIDIRFKADMQRLERRTRLIAMYTPKKFIALRKELFEKEMKEAATQPAKTPTTTAPSEEDADPAVSRWQDYVEQVAPDMGLDAIDRARQDWVELTSYDTLMQGGVDAIRLFLSTPELATEFPGLADPKAKAAFAAALDAAQIGSEPGKELTASDMEKALNNIIEVSKSTVKLPSDVITMEFTDGAMEKLDPFTAVIWPHELDEFDKNTRGTFGGVGVQIQMENGKLLVVSPLEDTPAFKAGIQAGDIISGINGKSTLGISVDQAVHTITGKPGTPVTLKIKRGTDPDKEYTLTRDIIKVTSVKGFQRDPADNTRWDYMLDPDTKIGYIRITGFQEETADELREALRNLNSHGMRGLVLDLRFNPGGLLKAAVDISDMFLQEGVIVSTRGRSVNAREYKWTATKSTLVPPDMPIAVLVNQYSASASEIFSGAMKDLHRGLIVGHRSFGKGSVQNLLPIGSERTGDGDPVAEMKLTTSYYYLPRGESLHRRDRSKTWGVDPDVAVDLTPEQLSDLVTQRRDGDIIHQGNVTTQPDTQAASSPDTQLDTALLMMRLQLIQPHA